MIKRRVLVHTRGQTVENTLVVGKMENKMEKEPILLQKESQNKEFGKMTSGLNG